MQMLAGTTGMTCWSPTAAAFAAAGRNFTPTQQVCLICVDRDLRLVRVHLAATVAREEVDHAAREAVRLQSEGDNLLIDGDLRLHLALGVPVMGLDCERAIRLLRKHAGEVRHAGELVARAGGAGA